MKKFLLTTGLYALVLAVLVVIINAAYMKKDTTWFAADHYRDMPEHITICNFGPSHGAASFDYTALEAAGYSCFNFSGGRQMLTYDNLLLKHYGDHLDAGGTAFLVMTYISVYGVPEREWEDFESYNNTYYRILPKALIPEYDPKISFYVARFPSLRAYFKLFPVLFSQPEPEPDGRQGADPEVVRESLPARYDNYILQRRGIIKQDSIDALYEMIAILNEKGVRPVMVTTPVMADLSSYIREQDPAFFDDWYGIIDRICADTGIPYYDYSEDPRFVYDYSLFSDADHMNRNGAEKFMQIITEEILDIRL